MTTITPPASIRLEDEARKGRRRLYPVTVVYTALSLTLFAYGLRSEPQRAAIAYVLGVLFWTWLEYMLHRYVLHGEFPDGPGLQPVLHRAFDHLHVEHHKRPWDGNHINGTLKDSVGIVGPLALLSVLFPPWSMAAFFAGILQAGMVEEWVHHSVHFYRFDNRYFRYIKRHHMNHHSPKGFEQGYGLSNGIWDVVFGTRFPAEVRTRLHAAPPSRRSPDGRSPKPSLTGCRLFSAR